MGKKIFEKTLRSDKILFEHRPSPPLSYPMPGRHEDNIWKAFDKKKNHDKKYPLAICKGCSTSMPGVSFLVGMVFVLVIT